ncbi:hypothetical protein M404DRAFT_625289 [Pisolithus tinctorius Marx 270]|uniref:Uncharacterized protein n=1 Tax=Pisolithus tinctorius Marx 270 TaxID=870435 RepID=A0A0C3J2B8_PISTI|nr:hypothetical protein M404DRAFT_625289 [Pisolithus tinctorius Marx 270]
MSRDKGGKHVCCVALRQSGDRRLDGDVKISLLITRNVAFKNHDKKFCSTLQELLAAIRASAGDEIKDLPAVKQKLWEELVHYNQPRIDRYADSLRDNLQAFKSAGLLDRIPPYGSDHQYPPYGNFEPTTFCGDPDIGPYSAVTHDAYMTFAQGRILELDNILCTKGRAWRRRLVEQTYAIRRMRSLQTLINSCPKPSVRHKLLRDIRFLGRLESCLRTFMEAALHIPGLAQLSIILIENLQPCSLSYELPPLVDTMQHLGQPLNTTTVRKFISKKWNVTKAELQFEQLQRKLSGKPLPTHAELQLILHITKTAYSENIREMYPYIGCSKLSCLLCAAFIKHFAPNGIAFRTRGSHGKIYPRWSIPDMDGLHDDMVTALDSALERMQNLLRSEFMKPIISTTHLPESSSGVTDDTDSMDDTDDDISVGKKELWEELLRYNQPRLDHCADCLRNNLKAFKATGSLDSIPHYTPQLSQNDDFEHRTFCDDPSIGPYSEATHDNYMKLAQKHILELDAILSVGDRATQRHLLADHAYPIRNINSLKIFINSCPEVSIRHRLLSDILALGRLMDCLVRACWMYRLGDLDYDTMQDFGFAVPVETRNSFLLYGLLLNGYHPNPSLPLCSDLYFEFGFVTGRGLEGEEVLPGVYRSLISRCSFTEFWTAFQSNNLVELMDEKGLGPERKKVLHFEDFMKIKRNHLRPSVWRLRHFVHSKDVEPPLSVLMDYGFFNCMTGGEIFSLKAVYKELLDSPRVDPMELHAACIKGELYNFARRHNPNLEQEFKTLMTNFYPLRNNTRWAGSSPSVLLCLVFFFLSILLAYLWG